MAILYGTTGDGTTLPVLVDQFGNLLAKGIEGAQGEKGEQGQQGEQGEPGPQGDPGLIQWPPNPQENDVLTYKNGEVTWGNPVTPPPTLWSQYMTNDTGKWTTEREPPKAFDALSTTEAYTYSNGPIYFGPPEIQIVNLQMSFATNFSADGYRYQVKCGDIQQEFPQNGDIEWIYTYTRFAGLIISESNPLEIRWLRPNSSAANGNVSKIWINGILLIDSFGLRRQAALINRINSAMSE